jgi:hypothetical protein
MKRWTVCLLFVAIPVTAQAVEVEGKVFDKTETVEGKTLKLIGAGLREKWVFDVYALGAYTESGNCDVKSLISLDEAKYIRLEMLRNVDADKMASSIGEAFDKNMPEGASSTLVQQRKTFQSYFKEEAQKGQKLEFIYLPGKGMTLKQNGKTLGPPITGFDFTRVFWSLYFSDKTCCEDLKEQVLKTCKGKG